MLYRLLLLTLFLIFACQPQTEATEADGSSGYPNIVYILADDLGWGDISVQNPESKIQTKQPESPREVVVHHSLDGMFSVRQGDWKLIIGRGSGGFTQPRRVDIAEGEASGQLYNPSEDPGEQNNVYTEQPEKVEELLAILTKLR